MTSLVGLVFLSGLFSQSIRLYSKQFCILLYLGEAKMSGGPCEPCSTRKSKSCFQEHMSCTHFTADAIRSW
ncbi:hypothetical protein KC19_8G114500 [Ceratodon purpureus]|uniref:Secreted protein n=1 Tax=Ceratodon purpureus TaxID=3225 RepID=A0A8T0H308_CERPU|nr:hypothetical protein KC19_8G114500 [Ceratodon purpureus]